MIKECFYVETGWLLDESDEEYDTYSQIYDKAHGFYDDDRYYVASKEEAISDAKNHVEASEGAAYVIVSNAIAPKSDIPDEELGEWPVENADYLLEDVVYSCARIDGIVKENFLKERNM